MKSNVVRLIILLVVAIILQSAHSITPTSDRSPHLNPATELLDENHSISMHVPFR